MGPRGRLALARELAWLRCWAVCEQARSYRFGTSLYLEDGGSGGLFSGLPENLFHALAAGDKARGDEQQVG